MEEISNFEIDERGVMLIPANESNLDQLSESNKIGVREIKMHNEVLSIAERFAYNARLLNYVCFSERLEYIPKEAFCGCVRLTCVDLPAKLSKIDDRAFMDSGLECLTLGDDVSLIGECAFANCNLSKLEFSSNCKIGFIGENAFAGNKRLKSVNLPNSVVEIGDGAFAGCVGLKELIVGPNVANMGNPFKSDLYIHKGKMPISLMVHLNSATIKIAGLEPIKAKDFESLQLDEKTNLRVIFTTNCVWVENLDRVRGISEFVKCSKIDFEKSKLNVVKDTRQKPSWLNEALLHDYLKQNQNINADKMTFDEDDVKNIVNAKSKFVELSFTCTKLIEVSSLKKYCVEHKNYLLDYFKTQTSNLDAVAVRTHQLNWEKLWNTLSNEQKEVHNTALGLLNFKQKIFMSTFGDSFDNTLADKVSLEQLNFLVKEGTRELEGKWIDANDDGELDSFTHELDEENTRLCKALTMLDYVDRLNIDKESFYQLADILVQNPNQWEEYLHSMDDSAVVGFIKALEHEYNWQCCYEHMPRKQRELYNHYKDDLLPAELHRLKSKFTRKEYDEFIRNGIHNFQSFIINTDELNRYKEMEKFVSKMDKAHIFAIKCKQSAEQQFKQQNKPPKDRDEYKKWEQNLRRAGEDAYYAKYNEIVEKVENDKIDYRAIIHVCKVEFKGKVITKNLKLVQKLRGKINKLKFKSLHLAKELRSQFL